MKPVQVILDEELLERLDATPEVKKYGRSAVLRQAAEEYLHRRDSREIAERYAAAYGQASDIGEELAGWEDQGKRPVGSRIGHLRGRLELPSESSDPLHQQIRARNWRP